MLIVAMQAINFVSQCSLIVVSQNVFIWELHSSDISIPVPDDCPYTNVFILLNGGLDDVGTALLRTTSSRGWVSKSQEPVGNRHQQQTTATISAVVSTATTHERPTINCKQQHYQVQTDQNSAKHPASST
jgi:hypothetical protein